MGDETQKDTKTRAPAKTPSVAATSATTEEAVAVAAQVEEERRYTVDELRAGSRRMFGVDPHAVAGALSTSDRKTHTEQQAQELIVEFMGRKVS